MCIPTSNVYGTNVGIRGSDSAPAAGRRGAAAVWVLLDGEEGRAERGLGCRRPLATRSHNRVSTDLSPSGWCFRKILVGLWSEWETSVASSSGHRAINWGDEIVVLEKEIGGQS